MQADWQSLIHKTALDDTLCSAYVWEPFARGSSNAIFLGRLKRNHRLDNPKTTLTNTAESRLSSASRLLDKVILRINAPDKDTPGVIREREAAILNRIQPYGWAPTIISNVPEQGWCLMQHYDSIETQQDKTPHLAPEHQQQLLDAIDELQAITIRSDGLRMGYPHLLNETYLPMALTRQDALAQASIESIKRDLNTLPTLPTCLVHHDIHLGNLVLSKPVHATESPNVIILDWEYAAMGNPWFDASCLSRYLSIPATRIHRLNRFKGLEKTTFEAALKRANVMTETLEKLWHWARESESLV